MNITISHSPNDPEFHFIPETMIALTPFQPPPSPPQSPDQLTYSVNLLGFPEWFYKNKDEIKSLFTPDMMGVFDTVENFALEVYAELHFPA